MATAGPLKAEPISLCKQCERRAAKDANAVY